MCWRGGVGRRHPGISKLLSYYLPPLTSNWVSKWVCTHFDRGQKYWSGLTLIPRSVLDQIWRRRQQSSSLFRLTLFEGRGKNRLFIFGPDQNGSHAFNMGQGQGMCTGHRTYTHNAPSIYWKWLLSYLYPTTWRAPHTSKSHDNPMLLERVCVFPRTNRMGIPTNTIHGL